MRKGAKLWSLGLRSKLWSITSWVLRYLENCLVYGGLNFRQEELPRYKPIWPTLGREGQAGCLHARSGLAGLRFLHTQARAWVLRAGNLNRPVGDLPFLHIQPFLGKVAPLAKPEYFVPSCSLSFFCPYWSVSWSIWCCGFSFRHLGKIDGTFLVRFWMPYTRDFLFFLFCHVCVCVLSDGSAPPSDPHLAPRPVLFLRRPSHKLHASAHNSPFIFIPQRLEGMQISSHPLNKTPQGSDVRWHFNYSWNKVARSELRLLRTIWDYFFPNSAPVRYIHQRNFRRKHWARQNNLQGVECRLC